MPLIVSSALAAIGGASLARWWRKRRGGHFVFLTNVVEPDAPSQPRTTADEKSADEHANLDSLDEHFERLNFHMKVDTPDSTLNIVRPEPHRFEVVFYLDRSEVRHLYPRVRAYFNERDIRATQISRNRSSSTFIVRIVAYPLGKTAREAAEACRDVLRTVFQTAESDSLTVRHSNSAAFSTP